MRNGRPIRLLKRQRDRQDAFPTDRIAFCAEAAMHDSTALAKWEDGKHTEAAFNHLCVAIAYNNYLEDYFDGAIPRETMLNELRIMGYPTEIVP